MTTILHVSDLHFGKPAVLDQIDAIEAAIQTERFDVVAISGDLSQRARSGEFQRAAVFLREARKYSQIICVPGNHDVAWWYAPLGVGDQRRVYENYRTYISADLEPTLALPDAFFAGVNTSHGITLRTLTWNMRDLSIIGDLTPAQLATLRTNLPHAPTGAAKIVVMHHNPVAGQLSQRYGLKQAGRLLAQLRAMDVALVLCGHDHQEAVTNVSIAESGIVVSTAGTVSSRSRGGRPSSYNTITVTPTSIAVTVRTWSPDAKNFLPGPPQCFAR